MTRTSALSESATDSESLEQPSESTGEPLQQLAEQRTEKSYERTLLSEERTYSSWMRTGLAAVATGFAIAKLIGESQAALLFNILGTMFISAGALVFVLGFWAYRQALQELNGLKIRKIPLWLAGGLSAWLFVSAIFALLLVLIA